MMVAGSTINKQIEAHTAVRTWLLCVAALVFAMVVVGGATRLTHSGLSITQWNPIIGIVPPLNAAEWNTAFDNYKTIPEYQVINKGMSLGEFKFIYWWEWSHRLLGRLVGLAFIVPFVVFLAGRRIGLREAPRFLVLLILGGLQGALGWYMVRSGLVDRVDVSQYRLAAHLLLASIIYAALIWTGLGIGLPKRSLGQPLTLFAVMVVLMVVAQLGLGGLVAGLDAGLSHNTFPLMDQRFIPDGLFVMTPTWKNFFENALTVQFDHRIMAYLLLVAVILHALAVMRSSNKSAREISAWVLVFAVVVQGALGVWTLLALVPLHLALLHQAMALLVLTAAIIHLHLVARRI